MFYAASLGPFVLRGPLLKTLPYSQQLAVLVHEQGHFRRLHFLKFWLSRHQKEYEADEHVAEQGLGWALIEFLEQHPHPETRTHPSSMDRQLNLLRTMIVS